MSTATKGNKMTKAQFMERIRKYAAAFADVRKQAATFCIEQEDLLEMVSLAVIAKQHALLVGPWGCNKTRTINVFSHLIGATNGQMFRATLDKTTPPEALLGPISPKALLEQDRFIRNLSGTIADATFAFIGEAFSGNSATRRALHSALNERYVENGGEKIPIKLHTAFLDSNEFPSRREDRPFYDRIMLRTEVPYLDTADKAAFISMRRSPRFIPERVAPILSLAEVREAAKLATLITVPAVIDEVMHTLRTDLFSGKAVQLSDRRWYHAYSVLRASAFLAGRDHVAPGDIWSLRFVLVDIVDGQSKAVTDMLKPYKGASLRDAEKSFEQDATALYDQAMQGSAEFRRNAIESIRALGESVIDSEVKESINQIAAKLEASLASAGGANEVDDFDDELTDSVLDNLIGFTPTESKKEGSAATGEESAAILDDLEEEEADDDEL